jgi:hypothetical protein
MTTLVASNTHVDGPSSRRVLLFVLFSVITPDVSRKRIANVGGS